MATDWAKVKLAYINSSKTLREVAEEFTIKAAGVMRRAAKEGWDAERKRLSASVSKTAQESLVFDRAAELARFNSDDLKIARALRQKAVHLLQGAEVSAADLRSLSSTFESARGLGLAALGMVIDSSGGDSLPEDYVLRNDESAPDRPVL